MRQVDAHLAAKACHNLESRKDFYFQLQITAALENAESDNSSALLCLS